MSEIISRHNEIEVHRVQNPTMIILHDTAGPTLEGAIETLKVRGLGYHYLVDVDGSVVELAKPDREVWHAANHNYNTIGIAAVGFIVQPNQVDSMVDLMNALQSEYDKLTSFTGHKHVAMNGKIDPRWMGEDGVHIDWAIDKIEMKHIETATGLQFITRSEFYPHE